MRTKGLRRRRVQGTSRVRRWLSMVDAGTEIEHFVTDEAAASGRRAGRYVAACAAVVVPGSLQQHGRRFCGACRGWAARR